MEQPYGYWGVRYIAPFPVDDTAKMPHLTAKMPHFPVDDTAKMPQ